MLLTSFLVRACFYAKKIENRMFGADQLIFVATRREKLEGVDSTPGLNRVKKAYAEATSWLVFQRKIHLL